MSSNTPQLRFAEFSGEWTPSKIGADFRFISTNSLSRDNLNYDVGEVKNIHYGDIHKKYRTLFDIDKEVVPYINSDISLARIGNDNYLQNGDVIFVDASEDYAETGKCIEVKNTANEAIIAGLHTIHARPKYDSTFAVGFFAYLANTRNVRQQIRVISQGTKVLSISSTTLAGVSIIYPKDTTEQKKIGRFLSAVDSKIEGLEQELGLLKRYKQGIMQRLFNQTLGFKDNHGNPFPAWQETTIGKITTSFSGGTPSSTNKAYYSGNIPFIKSGEISNLITEQFLSLEGLNSSSAKMINKGDLLFALYGATSGEVAISKLSGAINQAVLCLRTTGDNRFLYYWLQCNKYLILSKYLQGGQGNLSAEIIKKLKIKIPHPDEQKKIAQCLSDLDAKVEATQKKINAAREWKKGLLQKMFV